VTCIIELWPLFSGLSVHSLDKHCNNSEFHSRNDCLYIPRKIVISMYNHSSTRFPYLSVNHHCGIYSTSLGTDSQFQTMCMIIPRLGWDCSACSRLQAGSKSFMDILMTPQFYSRIGNHASTLPEYWQYIPQKCSYVHLTSLEYFSVSLSGQGQQIILDVVMSWDFTIASNSNVSACQHWWSLYWLCSSSISSLPSSFWAR